MSFWLCLLLAVSLVKASSYDDESSRTLEEFESTAKTISYPFRIIITSVAGRPFHKIRKGDKIARGFANNSLFSVDAPFDGLLGKVFLDSTRQQTIPPDTPIYEIYRRYKSWPARKPLKISNDVPSLRPTDTEYLPQRTTPTDSFFYKGYFLYDTLVLHIIYKYNELVQKGDLIVIGQRVSDGRKVGLSAPQDGKILLMNVVEGETIRGNEVAFLLDTSEESFISVNKDQ